MSPFPCRACGSPITLDEPIPRDAGCPSCNQDVRCCLNCRHYDPRLNNACRETEADPVVEKNRRNFCEFFSPNREPMGARGSGASREALAREKLGQLFGGSGAPAPPSARDKLDGLLGGTKPKDERAADARRKLDSLFGGPRPTDDAKE